MSETHIAKVPYPSIFHVVGETLIGSINSLVCMAFFHELKYHFVLWNPAVSVSKTTVEPKNGPYHVVHPNNLQLLGFG